MNTRQKQIGISSKAALGILMLAVLMTAAGAALLINSRLPVIVLSSVACYGALALAYAWTCFYASRLRTISSEFQEAAGQVAATTSQLASSSQSLAQAVSTQAVSISAATGTGELMVSITRQSAETGQTTAGLVGEARQLANQSAAGLELLTRTLRESNAAAGKIGKITKVVDEIAFQTNILALNAAIEAARAGQSGSGFAVVADEVRNLAQRCAKASAEIADLTQESIARAHAGEAEMEQVSGAMRALIGHTGQVKELVDEVANNCRELALGTKSVFQEMQQVEKLARDTAASSEQTAATSRQLSAQTDAIENLVERLNWTI